MIKILFVCHGNICRSPMAEFVLKDMVKKQGLQDQFLIASAATSREEIGNSVHYGTRLKLAKHNIYCDGKTARQMTRHDYDTYDFLLGMDSMNIRNMLRIVGEDKKHKIKRILDFSSHPRDIADPWYTDNFDITYEDIVEGCNALLTFLKETGRIKQ